MSTATTEIQELANREYKYGFVTDLEADAIPRGLSEDVVRAISAKKREPEWMLEFRLKAYRKWLTMAEPEWSDNRYASLSFGVCFSTLLSWYCVARGGFRFGNSPGAAQVPAHRLPGCVILL